MGPGSADSTDTNPEADAKSLFSLCESRFLRDHFWGRICVILADIPAANCVSHKGLWILDV